MCKEIEYLVAVKEHYDISFTWLAKQLNINPNKSRFWSKQALDYIFGLSKEISTSSYKEIKSVFDKHNFILPDHLVENIGECISQLNKESAELVQVGFEAMKDGKYSKTEIADMLLELADVRNRANKLEQLLLQQSK